MLNIGSQTILFFLEVASQDASEGAKVAIHLAGSISLPLSLGVLFKSSLSPEIKVLPKLVDLVHDTSTISRLSSPGHEGAGHPFNSKVALTIN